MRNFPFNLDNIRNIIKQYPTPFYIYDEKAICDNAQKLYSAFSWAKNFKNYFAVKATPTPMLLSILREQGMGFDCSSYTELLMVENLGVRGDEIMFTSNNTPKKDMQKAFDMKAIINLDDITHINFLKNFFGIPPLLCMRYNPGSLKKGNIIIGHPEDAKYGFTTEQIFEGYQKAKSLGVERFGLHTMVASNELVEEYFIETAVLLFNLCVQIKNKLNISIQFVNLGGGIGIPYKPTDKPVDYLIISEGIKKAYEKIIIPSGLDGLEIVMENGRVITGPYGYLVSTVQHIKETYKKYVGLDANMSDLMRPGIYGAYHHISVLGKEHNTIKKVYDITGSLCENNDKFAIDREMPLMSIGDIVVICDSGAHGHAMGFNYNGKLRSAELLLKKDGEVLLMRRAQTPEDYFSMVVWK